MKIAIIGGTGFVGSHLAQALHGHDVVRIARRTGTDVADGLGDALGGCDAVALCAGINRELGRQTFERVHVAGTRNVVLAAKAAGVRKIVLLSFLRARPDCGSAYHETKWAAEEIVRGSGLDYTILKAGIIYGKGDHMLAHLEHALRTFPVFGLVGCRDSFARPVAVEDVVRIMRAALVDGRLERATVSVVGPETISLSDVVRRVGRVIGQSPWFIRLPVRIHRMLAWGFENLSAVPLVSRAQIRILSEGVVEPLPPCEGPPDDLTPRTCLTDEQIRLGLPCEPPEPRVHSAHGEA